MRKVRDGEMEWNGMENNGENSGHYVVASRPPNSDRLQRRRSCQHYHYILLCNEEYKTTVLILQLNWNIH